MLRNLFLLVLFGCSGYRFTQQENPLSQYGIQSLSVPMFYNYSNLPEVHSDFTRETFRMLTAFSGLRLNNGYNKNDDAIMIGIIKSPEKVADSLRPTSLRIAQLKAPNAIGNKRDRFYIPATTDVQLYLHVIVIKKPTEEELALLKSGIGDQIKPTSKVIFNEFIPLNINYTREVLDNIDGSVTTNGAQVVATQNAGVQRKVLKTLAEQAATNIRDMILYAF
jgi:hypothetical protein